MEIVDHVKCETLLTHQGEDQRILLNICSKSSKGKQKQISVDCLVRLRGSIEFYEITKWVNV